MCYKFLIVNSFYIVLFYILIISYSIYFILFVVVHL